MISSIIANDLWFEVILLSVRNPVLVQVMSVVTFFGNTSTVIVLAGLVGILLALARSRQGWSYLAGLGVALLGAAVSVSVLKVVVERARPDLFIQAVAETSFSFPSWHATGSVAFYGFVAFILCRLYPDYKKVVVVATTLVILVIGFSRLYLGVHFPSDVAAGYILGGVWLFAGIRLTNRLLARAPRI
ncbi:MAG: phosphatase PAP2 family protein [Minisyncoccia bacterium]